MNIEEYERMYQLEDTYWWFQGRMHMILGILERYMRREPRPGRVLDVGCGTGLMLGKLKHWNPIGLDFSPLSLEYCSQRGIRNLLRGDVTALPFKDNCLDLVLALDLIEHVERDDRMVDEVFRVLRPGGYFMATVPAHQWLWSDHDISLHHHRRYSHGNFRELLAGAGLRPVKYSYGISFTYPGVVAFRMAEKMLKRAKPDGPKAHLIHLPGFMNQSLIEVLKLEATLLRHMDLPFGVSLMALCRKPAPARAGAADGADRQEPALAAAAAP